MNRKPIAKLKSEDPDCESITVVVQQDLPDGDFYVFVDGGLLGDGRDEAKFGWLWVALEYAANELRTNLHETLRTEDSRRTHLRSGNPG